MRGFHSNFLTNTVTQYRGAGRSHLIRWTATARLWQRRVVSLRKGLVCALRAARGARSCGGVLLCRAGVLCLQVFRGLGAHKARLPQRILVACNRAAMLRRLVSALASL